MRISHSFVGDGGTARFDERLSLLRVRGQMQIREENLVLSQLRPFGRLRFLDLYDHFARCEYLTSGAHNCCASLAVILIGCANPRTGIGLDQYATASGHVLTDGPRRQAHAIFVRLDFPGNTDLHLHPPI